MKKKKGNIEIIASAVAAVASVTTLLAVSSMFRQTGRSSAQSMQYIAANALASELLEVFRSETPTQIINRYSVNPVTQSSSAPYTLCSHINIANLGSQAGYLNRDPAADISLTGIPNIGGTISGSGVPWPGGTLPSPAAILAMANNGQTNLPNRWYQLEVINLTTLAVNTTDCGLAVNSSSFQLGANETFLITVGVTWNDSTTNQIQRVVLSDVVPLPGGAVPPLPTSCGTFTVSGQSNPYLAGVVANTTINYDALRSYFNTSRTIVTTLNDTNFLNPNQTPVLVNPTQTGCFNAGAVLSFAVTGATADIPNAVQYNGNGQTSWFVNTGNPANCPGVEQAFHVLGPYLGKSQIVAPMDSLVGVFLTNSDPSTTTPPTGYQFNNQSQYDLAVLAPQIGQIFFIGTGVTSNSAGGQTKQFIVPAGATQLYLGTMDQWNWNNNAGSFQVSITSTQAGTVPPVPTPTCSIDISPYTVPTSMNPNCSDQLELTAGASFTSTLTLFGSSPTSVTWDGTSYPMASTSFPLSLSLTAPNRGTYSTSATLSYTNAQGNPATVTCNRGGITISPSH